MKFGKFLDSIAPAFALVLVAGLSGCDGMNITVDGDEGKKLSELDLSGKPPEELALVGPDQVEVTEGDKLAITVDGDPEAVEKVRFVLKDGKLAVTRTGKIFSGGKLAVVHITMPAPQKVDMVGSGKIITPSLARDAKVAIVGSGRIESQNLGGGKLEVTIPGTGSFRAVGNVDDLEINLIGTGGAELDAVRTPKANVTIVGTGGAAFTSDGEVKANIVGTGTVTVKGRARCTVSGVGSGKLVCENGVTSEDGVGAPDMPDAPDAPEVPEIPKK